MTLLEQAECNLKLARAQYWEALRRGSPATIGASQVNVQRAYAMRHLLREGVRPRVFIFAEDEVHVYRNPEAWADDMLRTRDLPHDVILAVLQRFAKEETLAHSNAAAEFYWREVL